ncbi:MAG: hypothetical protein ACXVCP_18510 [Bdellovibrio sp.]
MDKRHKSHRHLVTEQPGMTILTAGLVISFLIGYTAKSWLSSARVTAKLEKAAGQIHKNVSVKFNSAQIRFSDGILPRFEIVISDVKMESPEECWAAPVLEVNELRLPLSITNLIRGHSPIQKIIADSVKLTLREKLKECGTETNLNSESRKTAPLVSLSPSEQSQKYRNDVKSISIQNLKIVAEKYPEYSTEFEDMNLKVKSFEPKVIELTAKTHFLKGSQVGDYLSYANLFIQYKESPEPTIQSHFFGNWREGHYSIIGSYILDERSLSLETDLKHIPLSQILTTLQKYNIDAQDLNGKQVWVSSKARIAGPIDKIRHLPLEIKDLLLEGDLGELRVDRIDISSLEPLQYSPISVEIQKLDIAKLLQLFNRSKNTNVLAQLGQFSGRAEILSDKRMNLWGEHRGLEFVFSNKGQRELQVIDKMEGDVSFEDNQWKFLIKKIMPLGGKFQGSISMKADRDFDQISMKTVVDELELAPPVQNLMTNGGKIGSLNLNLDLRLNAGELSFLKGYVQLGELNVEGAEFGKTKSNFDWSKNEFILNTQINSLRINSKSAAGDVFQKVTNSSWWTDDKLELNSLGGQFRTKNFKLLTWKNFQGQIGKSGKLLAEGSWDELGRLKGTVTNRLGKSRKKWFIDGTRNEPKFIEETALAHSIRK